MEYCFKNTKLIYCFYYSSNFQIFDINNLIPPSIYPQCSAELCLISNQKGQTMKPNDKKFFNFNFLFLLSLAVILSACKSDKEKAPIEEEPQPTNKVTIVTQMMDFDGPDEIPSGWTTFEYINNSEETHFFVFEKLPEGKTLEDSKREVIPVFVEGMDLINAGNPEEGYAAFGKLPEWFSEIVFLGGPGLISPKNKTETTLYLEPGYYIIECYVKMPTGQFHSALGMVAAITVTDESNNQIMPESTVQMTVSSENGFVFEQGFTAGNHVIEVNFEDQVPHENFVGHDVHLVKLTGDADLDALEKWMNWSDPDAFKTPAPEGVQFLGGTQEMPAGNTAYFKADLVSGTYAFIAEVPNASEKNMLTVFNVE